MRPLPVAAEPGPRPVEAEEAPHRRVESVGGDDVAEPFTVDVDVEVSPLSEVAGSLSAEDAQELREIIDREFERVDPREW